MALAEPYLTSLIRETSGMIPKLTKDRKRFSCRLVRYIGVSKSSNRQLVFVLDSLLV